MMALHNQVEEDFHRAIQQSLKEPKVQGKELSVAQTMEILQRNYSEKDPDALKKLCMEYEGRGEELEKYLETNFKDIPTREEAEQKKKRLENEAKRMARSLNHKETIGLGLKASLAPPAPSVQTPAGPPQVSPLLLLVLLP